MVLTAILPQTAPYKLRHPFPLLFTAVRKPIKLTENPQMPPKPLNNPYNAITAPDSEMSPCGFASLCCFCAEFHAEKCFLLDKLCALIGSCSLSSDKLLIEWLLTL